MTRQGWSGRWVVLAGVLVVLAGLVTTVGALVQPSSAGPVHPVPDTIAADCSADVTAELNGWLATVPDGTPAHPSVLDFGTRTCFRVDGTLAVTGRTGLLFRGRATTIDQSHVEGAPDRSAWRIRLSSWITLSGFHVSGPHRRNQQSLGLPTRVSSYGFCASDPTATCEHQHGFAVLGSTHIRLSDNRTAGTYGDSVLVMWDYPLTEVDSSDIVIERHRVDGAGRQGVAIVSGRRVTVRDSLISGVAQQPIDIEPEDARFPVSDIEIVGNRFGQSYASIVLASGRCSEVRRIKFEDNTEIEPNITSKPSLYLRNPCRTEYRGEFVIRGNSFWVDEWGDDGDTVAKAYGDIRDVLIEFNEARYTCAGGTRCEVNETAVSAERATGWTVGDNRFRGVEFVVADGP